MAKWLGSSYFAWRNTNQNSEEGVQNVKVNIEQFRQTITAALAVAATKAQARYLQARSLQFQFGIGEQLGVESSNKTRKQENVVPRQVVVYSSFRIFVAAVFPLIFMAIAAAILRFFCKFSRRSIAIISFFMLASISLMTQMMFVDFFQLQQPKPAAEKLNTPEANPVQAAILSSATNTNSLLAQFLLRYSSITGACCRLHLLVFSHDEPQNAQNAQMTT
jgi:hypothetical protein